MAKELEFKYEPKNQDELHQVLSSETVAEYLASRWEELAMETVYYDTPEGDLSSLRWTLRYRSEGGKGVACLKTPTDDPNARNEYETEADGMNEAALQGLLAAGAPKELLRMADLKVIKPLCGAKFTRRVAAICLPDGTKANISGDWGRLFGGERSQSLCELEVELTEGSENAVKAFCALLAREFDLHRQPKSKFARARALAMNR